MSTQVVNTHEAKSRLSQLIRAAEEGHDVILARNGEVVAKIIPWPPARVERLPGAWSGLVVGAAGLIQAGDDVDVLFDESASAPLA